MSSERLSDFVHEQTHDGRTYCTLDIIDEFTREALMIRVDRKLNSRLRQECLNASWLLSMADARARIEEWTIDYNQNRPHSSLGGSTPAEFADQLKPAQTVA